jgi:vancomycin permeability regulator SanA
MILDVQSRYSAHFLRSKEQLTMLQQNHSSQWTALVLGASILANGEPSDALRDRLDMAILLYQRGFAQRILLTGDDGALRVDEIDSMKKYIDEKGIPTPDILIDGQGYRTYESCKNAAHLLGSDANIFIVTQRFHMARALYLCNQMHLKAFGAIADFHTYQRSFFFWMRDLLASAKAWWDIHMFSPQSPVKKM